MYNNEKKTHMRWMYTVYQVSIYNHWYNTHTQLTKARVIREMWGEEVGVYEL